VDLLWRYLDGARLFIGRNDFAKVDQLDNVIQVASVCDLKY
jgi:hypothetical protein